MECKLCDHREDDLKKLTTHIRSTHSLNSEEYTIMVFHGGSRPVCLECGGETRYVSFTFKEYCKDHSKLAMKAGGAKGGLAEAWNKGKTKDTDERLSVYSSRISGSGNHFFGKRHTQETIRKISENKMLSTSSIEDRIVERASEFRLLTSLDDYRSRQQQYLQFECLK